MSNALVEEHALLLPRPLHAGVAADAQRYLVGQAETVLKHTLAELRSGKATLESLCCGLGRIAGYYDILSELQRQQRQREEENRRG